jgi:hypothetical protein
MPARGFLLVLVVVLVLEISSKIEEEDENYDEDEPNRDVFHTGASARFTVRNDNPLGIG